MVCPARQFNGVADEERVLDLVRELVAELGNEAALRPRARHRISIAIWALAAWNASNCCCGWKNRSARGSMKMCWLELRPCRT